MNYGLRNTLILALTLIILAGGGWLILHFNYSSTIEELEETKQEKEEVVEELSETASLYDMISTEHSRQVHIREYHPKELFPDHRTGRIYDFLRRLNRGISFTELNYSVSDSVTQENYGYLVIAVEGEGYYRNLYNFIHRIEHSSPIIQIESVEVQNINELNRLSRVNFRIRLHAYYNRDDRMEYHASLELAESFGDIGHNPFYPLVHPVPPNDLNRVDVDNSRLIGMTSRYVLVEDQNGNVRRLSVGEPVYLGSLQRIDTGDQLATFRLNRGGLLDVVTLNLE